MKKWYSFVSKALYPAVLCGSIFCVVPEFVCADNAPHLSEELKDLEHELQALQDETAKTEKKTSPASQPAKAPLSSKELNQLGINSLLGGADEDSHASLQDKVYENVVREALPMRPDQIQDLKKHYDEDAYAGSSPLNPPKPVSTSQQVELSPGSAPPVVRLARGFVTAMVFIDQTGAPWPIEFYDLGDPGIFNIQWDRKSNTMLVQAMTQYRYGNLAVKLKGLNTPVMITLVPGQGEVDYRVDLRIKNRGPNAITFPIDNPIPNAANPMLMGVLDGVAPEGSKVLQLNSSDAEAWLYKNKIYLRTSLTVLSPSWLGVMASADGTKAYEMLKTPVILVSRRGQTAQLKVEGL